MNSTEVTSWDVNKIDLQTLDVHLDMHEMAHEFDRVTIMLMQDSETDSRNIGAVSYSKLQLKAQGDKVKLSILKFMLGSYSSSDFSYPTHHKLTENYQDELGLKIRVVGEEKTAHTSEWSCSSSCYSNCNQTCNGGYSTATFDYGNPVILSERNSFISYQRQGWDKKLDRENEIKAERDRLSRIQDAKDKKAGTARGIFFGTIGWGIAGILIWDNFFNI